MTEPSGAHPDQSTRDVERYRLGMRPDGTIAAFTDGDRNIAGRDLTVLRLVKAEDYDRLRAENDELRAELGRRDDALFEIGKVVQAYEAHIHRSPQSDETEATTE